MKNIKLFENFLKKTFTEEEARDTLIELEDVGYDVLCESSPNNIYISITAGNEFFDIVNVSEPILELISYFEEKYGDSFSYFIKYIDVNTECEMNINNLEEFIKDYPQEDTYEVIIILRLKN
jgi:hypothetical protein